MVFSQDDGGAAVSFDYGNMSTQSKYGLRTSFIESV